MQTRTYGDLFKLIQSLSGVGSFASSEQDDIANFINRRFFEAFETSPIWPRYLVNGDERDINVIDVLGATSSGVNGSYKLVGTVTGASVKDGSNLYMQNPSIASGTGSNALIGPSILKNNNDVWNIYASGEFNLNSSGSYEVAGTGLGPVQFFQLDTEDRENPTDVIFFEVVNGSGTPRLQSTQSISYSQVRKQTIGEFIRVHRTHPFLNNSALEYDFYADVNGANLLNLVTTTEDTAFVTYKIPFTPFSTSSNYSTSTEEIPAEFFHYLAHATYADFLRMDGQTDKALVEEQTAGTYLALELEKVDLRMNNNTINKRFSTYVNRQSR